jgi:hypothetical protein
LTEFRVLRTTKGLVVNIDSALFRGPQGAPGPAGAQGSQNSNALSNTWFVDVGTTVPTAQQNGSIGLPYKTLTSAIAAHSGGGLSATFILTPGDYSAEPDINIPADAGADTTIFCPTGLQGGSGFDFGAFNDVHTAPLLPGFTGGAIFQGLHLYGCAFNQKNIVQVGFIDMGWSTALGNGTQKIEGSAIYLNDSFIDVKCSALGGGFDPGVFAHNTSFYITTALIQSASTNIQCSQCKFNGVIEVKFTGAAGTFQLDAVSNFWFKAATETLTNGAKQIINDTVP